MRNSRDGVNPDDIYLAKPRQSTVAIKPQARECLDDLKFDNKSFSVQHVQRKERRHQLENLDSLGLAPSIADRHVQRGSGACIDGSAIEGKSNAPEEPNAKARNRDGGNQELEEDLHCSQEDGSPDLAQWLYDRCKAAVIFMEHSLSPVELALITLQAIQSVSDDVDNFEGDVQDKLFDALRGGKKRDQEFLMEASSRAMDLHRNGKLVESRLRGIAVKCASPRKESEGHRQASGGDDSDSDESSVDLLASSQGSLVATLESSQVPQHVGNDSEKPSEGNGPGLRNQESASNARHASCAAIDSTSKKPRARRKKKPTRKKDLFSANGDDLGDQDGSLWNFLAPADKVQVNVEERSTKCDARSELLPNSPNRSEEGHTVEDPNNKMAKVIGIQHRKNRSPKKMQDFSEPKVLDGTSNPMPTESAGDGYERQKTQTEVAVATMGEAQTASSSTCKLKKPSQQESTEYFEVERSEVNNTDRVDKSKRQPGRERARQVVSSATVMDKAQPRGSREGRRSRNRSSQQNAAGDEPENVSRIKTRKRGKSMNVVRIMFTGIESDKTNMQWIDEIGAELVESIKDANTVTHVIVTDGKKISMRRTPKLMICLCNTSNVVSLQWLEQSARMQTVLDTKPFLWLNDKKAQKAYNFDMETTLNNGMLARKRRGGLLGGWCVYICQGVAGNKAPPMDELRMMVEGASGIALDDLLSGDAEFTKTIILTGDKPTKKQLAEPGVAEFKRKGARLLSPSSFFDIFINQNLFGIDQDDEEEDDETFGDLDGNQQSQVSHTSTMSVISDSPVKTPASRGLATARPKNSDRTAQRKPRIWHGMTRDQFMEAYQKDLTSSETGLHNDNEAFSRTEKLMKVYHEMDIDAETPRGGRSSKKAGRSRRKRKSSISPLISADSPIKINNKPLRQTKSDLAVGSAFILWEAYVLFELHLRLEDTAASGVLADSSSLGSFPTPNALSRMSEADDSLSLKVLASQSVSGLEIFGTLQDVFTLHKQSLSSGAIPEQVIALFALKAIEAVGTMHQCGVAHNDLSLDSFILVRQSTSSGRKKKKKGHESYGIQIVGFGYKSVVHDAVSRSNVEHDYSSLGNVIHLLLTGGVEISLARVGQLVQFTSKPFIQGNQFLRGSATWCNIIDSLICIGENTQHGNESNENERNKSFRIRCPLDPSMASAESQSREHQFVWSCRTLQDLSLQQEPMLASFLDGLRPHNPRFIQSAVDLSSITYGENNTRLSFQLSMPPGCPGRDDRHASLTAREEALTQKEQAYEAKLKELERVREELLLMRSGLSTSSQSTQKHSNSLKHRGEGRDGASSQHSQLSIAKSRRHEETDVMTDFKAFTPRLTATLQSDKHGGSGGSKRKATAHQSQQSQRSATSAVAKRRRRVEQATHTFTPKGGLIRAAPGEKPKALDDDSITSSQRQSQGSRGSTGGSQRRSKKKKTGCCTLQNLGSPPPQKVYINIGSDDEY